MAIPARYLADSRNKKRINAYSTKNLDYIKSQTLDHDDHDSFDSYCVFQREIIRAIRLYGEDSEEYIMMENMAAFHLEKMSLEFFAREKESLGLITSIDLIRHGESLCKSFLRK